MLTYQNWDKFCSKILNSKIKTLTAAEAVNHSKLKSKYLIIKHDVETNVAKALKLALIEKKYNINATYYVQSYLLDNKKNIEILREIYKLGHEVTYHYDVLDSNDGDFNLADKEFRINLKKFKKYGFKISTVCPHGNPIKIRNGWNSNKDFFRNKIINKKYSNIHDIVVNPERFSFKKILYISDAGFGWKKIIDVSRNDKVKFNDVSIKLNDIFELIDENKTMIISTHPHRWVNSKILFLLNRNIFLLLRVIARTISKFRILKILIDKYYYLAKKI